MVFSNFWHAVAQLCFTVISVRRRLRMTSSLQVPRLGSHLVMSFQATMADVNELSKRLDALTAFVEKQAKMIGKTGEQLVSMQVQNVKQLMGGNQNVDMEDYVTNDDIVQLVGELQGQLDSLEERTTRRMFNCHLDVEKDEGTLAPITNKDGDEPGDSFPKTVGEFKKLDKKSIVQLSRFYELVKQEIPENYEPGSEAESEDDFWKRMETLSDKEVDGLHDELSRFLGLRVRKTGGW